MSRYLRSSRYNKLFLLIGFGAVVFISFQVLSLRALSKSARQQSQTVIEDFEVLDSNEDGEGRENIEPDARRSVEKEDTVHLKHYVLGVSPEDMYLYVPDLEKMFTCLHSKKRIPFAEVNDNYCDCDDNTDEPGTSACDYKFYCKRQFPNMALIVLPSNRVNDGICDCCDGSDEWQKISLSVDVFPDRLVQSKSLSVKYSPCQDHCDKIIETKKEDEKIHNVGKRLKQTYINAARLVPDKENYGPDGVFYKLSRACFEYKGGEYEYSVCPFKKVTQEHFPSPPFTLGKISEWVHKKNGRYILQMDGGDSHLCPDGFGRKSVITFLCGLHDRVINVQEDDKCSYVIKFSTPAAC